MWGVSAAFFAAVATSHVAVSRVEVLSSTGALLALPHVDSGGANIDGDGEIRRRCDVRLRSLDLIPAEATDLFHPLSGNEIRLYRGVRFTDDTEEIVPLGTFGIDQADVTDSGDSVDISIAGYDRAARVAQAKLTDYYQVPSGEAYDEAIRDLLVARVPTLTFNFAPVAYLTPALLFEPGDDPWARARQMAAAVGHDLYLDPLGVCVLAPVIDPATAPVVATYEEGEGSALLSVQRGFSRDVVNHYVVTGETTGNATPVRGEAKDTDPNSATYYLGPYGDVVEVVPSSYVGTTDQATAAAAALLVESLSRTGRVNISTLVNPAHEAGDVIGVTRERIGVDARYQIVSCYVPIGSSGRTTIMAAEVG